MVCGDVRTTAPFAYSEKLLMIDMRSSFCKRAAKYFSLNRPHLSENGGAGTLNGDGHATVRKYVQLLQIMTSHVRFVLHPTGACDTILF